MMMSYITNNLRYELKFKYIQNIFKLLSAPSLTSYKKVEFTWADDPFDL